LRSVGILAKPIDGSGRQEEERATSVMDEAQISLNAGYLCPRDSSVKNVIEISGIKFGEKRQSLFPDLDSGLPVSL
jgi:hypothetical protein